MTRKLEGQVALVSGSGRGIGREIALKLASEGARLVINDLDQAPAEQTVADIVANGGQAVACILLIRPFEVFNAQRCCRSAALAPTCSLRQSQQCRG